MRGTPAKTALAVLAGVLVWSAAGSAGEIEDVDRLRMSATVDLDGDGKPEQIKLARTGPAYGAFILTVNGATITDSLGDEPDGFLVVDIDENDSYKEVGVHTPGPSDDDEYFYFWYNGKELHRTGRVRRWPELLGHGIVLVRDSCGFSQRTDKYVLTKEHKLKQIPQELYWVGAEGKALKAFPIYSTRDGDRVQANVRKDSTVLLVLFNRAGGPQRSHYLLKTEHGQLGWLRDDPSTVMLLPVAD